MALDVAEVETPTCLAISVNGNLYASTNSIAKCPEALNFWARTKPIYYTPQGGFVTLKVLTKVVILMI
jgi:hypothetical protein